MWALAAEGRFGALASPLLPHAIVVVVATWAEAVAVAVAGRSRQAARTDTARAITSA